jgi:hypothetical protein
MAKIVTSCLSNISLKSSYFVENPDSVTFFELSYRYFFKKLVTSKTKEKGYISSPISLLVTNPLKINHLRQKIHDSVFLLLSGQLYI